MGWALAVLALLVFSKYVYLASLTSYYTFYLIGHFHLTQQEAQFQLFAFLFAAAAGTVIGGPLGDRLGRTWVLWFSILGVAPFTLVLPYADLFWTEALAVAIGFILASAFSAILVFAQELVPGRVGMVSGLFFGAAFGVAGISAAALGALADRTSIEFVYALCSYLPLIGICTAFLPGRHRPPRHPAPATHVRPRSTRRRRPPTARSPRRYATSRQAVAQRQGSALRPRRCDGGRPSHRDSGTRYFPSTWIYLPHHVTAAGSTHA